MSDPCAGEAATHSACPCVLRRLARMEAALRKLLAEFDEAPGPLARWMEHVARAALGEADG